LNGRQCQQALNLTEFWNLWQSIGVSDVFANVTWLTIPEAAELLGILWVRSTDY
jgi:hypothetical protein